MKKGFTLIELLAVITILAIIALITTPIIIDIINSGKRNAFLDSAKALVKAADNYYAESELSDDMLPLVVTYENSSVIYSKGYSLEYKGKNPYSGNIKIDNDGQVEMKIYDNASNVCAVKTINDRSPYLDKNVNKANCHL